MPITLCDRHWAGARAHRLQRAPAMPHVIVDQVRGSRLCPAALLADATYLNAACARIHAQRCLCINIRPRAAACLAVLRTATGAGSS